MEQAVATLSDESNPINSSVKPVVVEDVKLLSPGIWTAENDGRPTKYTSEEIENGFSFTRWDNMNLFLDHKDSKGSAVGSWIGFIRNPKMLSGELIGNLEIWHPMIGMFIEKAKAQFGVSATTNGFERIDPSGGPSDYKINSYRSFSLVDEPGCETAWLPKSLANSNEGDKKVVGGTMGKEKTNFKSDKPDINISEKNLESCKEVKKMNEEKETQKSIEEKSEEKEVASESESKSDSNEEVKNLHAKIDKLSEAVIGISETVKTLASEKEEEKSKDKPEEKEKSKEESVKEELEEAKKELSALKKEVNSPDKKTLAGSNSESVSTEDSNFAMLGFLREKGNIPIY